MRQEELKPIIDTITQEVMNRLESFLENKEANKTQGEIGTKPKEKLLLVFTGGPAKLDEVLDRLKIIEKSYDFLAVFSTAAKKACGVEQIQKAINFDLVEEDDLYSALDQVDRIIFPTLTQNTAAKGAMGIRDSVASEVLACGLLLKKQVIGVTDAIPIRSMPPAYGRMVGEILRKLEQLGVELCTAKDLSLEATSSSEFEKTPASNPCKEKDKAKEATDKPIARDLLIEGRDPVTSETIARAVMEGYGKLILEPKTIITPMAKDTAKEKNILLEWAVN